MLSLGVLQLTSSGALKKLFSVKPSNFSALNPFTNSSGKERAEEC